MTIRYAGAALAAMTIAALAPASAHAIATCTGVDPAVTPILSGQGSLESVIVDARGRLYYTASTAKELRRIDAPGAPPQTIASGIESPGGLAIDGEGRILLGQGDAVVTGVLGNLMPSASVLRIDPESLDVEVYASGLQMANGLVRAADGSVYASSDVGLSIDRISADRTVQTGWARVTSANGMAIDRSGRYLFAAQTFQPAAISRVDLLNPSSVETYAQPSPDGIASGPDGMTIDGRDRLFVAANAAGEVWRVDTDRGVCAVGKGLTTTSAVAFGQSDRGFSRGRLFAVGFDGVIAEVPGARVAAADAPPPPADRIGLAAVAPGRPTFRR